MKNIIFYKYWHFLPRSARMLLIGGILGVSGLGFLYVLPYSEPALYFLAGLDFTAMVMMGMGAVYAVFDTLKGIRRRRNVTK